MGIRDVVGESVAGIGEAIKPADESPPTVTPVKAPWWVILLTLVGAVVLFVAGVLVLREGRDMWVNPDPPEVAATPTKETSKVVKGSVKKGAQSQTTTSEKTVERASQGGGRSEGLALATLATGAALLLAGAFASRLTSIKLPGGVELMVAAAYTAGAEAGATSTAKAAVVAKDKGKEDVLADEHKLAEAGKKALQVRIGAIEVSSPVAAASAGGVPALQAIDDEKLSQAVDAAVEEVAD